MKDFDNDFKKFTPFCTVFMKYIYFIAFFGVILWFIFTKTRFYYVKPIHKPIRGGLNTYDVVLEAGDSYQLHVFGTLQKVKYQSTDIKVATVSYHGTIQTWRPGTTIIKVRYANKTLKCRVRVVKLSNRKMKLKVGDTKKIKMKNVRWGVTYSSNNRSVARVSSNGRIKAIKKGRATITVKYKKIRLKCLVIVE